MPKKPDFHSVIERQCGACGHNLALLRVWKERGDGPDLSVTCTKCDHESDEEISPQMVAELILAAMEPRQ